MKKWLLIALALALLCVSVAAQAMEITYTGTVTGGKLHMRKEPNSSAKVVETYGVGTEVTILENDGTWCHVQKGNKEGYMMTQYLIIKANYPHIGWGITENDGSVLTLYKTASQDGEIGLQCMSGAAFELVAKDGDWYQVRSGQSFYFVEAAKITVLSGNFEPDMATTKETPALTMTTLRSAPKKAGSAISSSRDSGLPYSFTYPILGVAEADEAIDIWLDQTLTSFEDDYNAHHNATGGKYTVNYQAQLVDDRYAAIVLLGEYTVDNTTISTLFTINVDMQDKVVYTGSQLFQDTDSALFLAKCMLATYLTDPVEGCDGVVDDSWLEYAVLTSSGLDIYLPAGLHLPLRFGIQKLTIPYSQIVANMTLGNAFLEAHKRTIDPSKPMVALTFDDGPSEETDRLLQVLAQYDARATFCVQGYKVEQFADTVCRAVAQGNEIANHTWNHPYLNQISASSARSQIERTNEIVRQVTGGYTIKVLRPPYGKTNADVRSICKSLNMIIAHWKVDTEDWSTLSTSKTYKAIMNGAKTSGVIILCHDIYPTTVDAAIQAIPELVSKGIQLVTVSELLSFHKDGVQPGTVYAYLDDKNLVK